MAAIFEPLRPGEPLGVAALSGPVDGARLERGLAALRAWGHPVVEASNLRAREGYLAGEDGARLAGLVGLLDAGVRVIVAARGGYGATRLLRELPWRRLEEAGACVVGFSDVTAVTSPLAAAGAAQVHGPMVAAGMDRPDAAERLRRVLDGELAGKTLFRFREHAVVRPGGVEGRAAGGNLATLTALLGTPWEPDLDDAVLFLEEVGEPLYRLDRMLTQLASSERLSRVRAVVGGSLRGCRPAARRDEVWRRLLAESLPSDAVIVTGLPFGHGARNMAFPIGVPVAVDTRSGTVRWSRTW